jgi:peptide/nickel transport system substrate-binding protein
MDKSFLLLFFKKAGLPSFLARHMLRASPMTQARPLLCCLAALLLTGPAFAQGSALLRIGIPNDPDVLDPTFSRTYTGTLVMTSICDKLFDFDAHLNIVPMLATGYDWVDPKTLLIHLRSGVQFQDGEPFDAAAVQYKLERDLNAPGSFRRSEISAMDHVEVVDPLTVRVVMKQPFSPFVAVLTDRAGMMVAPRAAAAADKNFGNAPVCAGPYRFTERVAQDHITVERFPGYWDAARIHYDRVTYDVIPDSSIALRNLQAGALDMTQIAPLDAATVQHDPALTLISTPSLGYGALTVNIGPRADTPLGRDARVRQAFNLSIDRAALSQVVFGGLYQPNAQATSALSPLYAPQIVPPTRDIARAHALLEAAGVKPPIPVKLIVANAPATIQAAEVIQSMAAEAGFAVQVDVLDFGASLAAIQAGDFSMSIGGWSGLLDTDSDSWSFLHTGGALNTSHYSNPTVDALLDQARAVTAVDERRAIYARLWQQENEDLPVIYLYTPRNIEGVSKKVAGFTLLADGLLRLQDVHPAP